DIELRDNGEMWRDMTYIGDVVEVISKLILSTDTYGKPEIFNVGNQSPVKISEVLDYISKKLEITPQINSQPKGEEEPVKTWADTSKLGAYIGYSPSTRFDEGLEKFIEWYLEYYNI
ncbi:MAG TPA: NAD-dependent epimerase/dehydratase family protein, partial [Candidatus Babeliaceae bacterium]|nr:NAD-dependent epimerase/dehydratase family protein [Candidatus Babeliaceae bacterium]